jgi:hypothetical protein
MDDLTTIPSYAGGWLSTREHQKAIKKMERHRSTGAVIAARESVRIDAIAHIAESALLATSDLSALEAALMQRTPHAAARLQHVADSGCAAMAAVVVRAGRGLA